MNKEKATLQNINTEKNNNHALDDAIFLCSAFISSKGVASL